MTWSAVAPEGLEHELALRLTRAARGSYDANCERYSPDDLGDDLLIFGQMVTKNARHLFGRELESLDGLEVVASGLIWWVEYERDGRRTRLWLYKAPPGSRSIADLVFDNDTKKQLSGVNAAQLGLVINANNDFQLDPEGIATEIVIVMFGSPEEGFSHAQVGAPFTIKAANDGKIVVRWQWDERFDVPIDSSGPVRSDSPSSDDSGDSYNIRLRDDDARRGKGS